MAGATPLSSSVGTDFVTGAALSQISWQAQRFHKIRCRLTGRRSSATGFELQMLSREVICEVQFLGALENPTFKRELKSDERKREVNKLQGAPLVSNRQLHY